MTNYFKASAPGRVTKFWFFEDTSAQDTEYRLSRARLYGGTVSVWRRRGVVGLVAPLVPEVGERCPFSALALLSARGNPAPVAIGSPP